MDLEYVRFLLALLFVLGLIGLLALLLRRFGFGTVRISPAFRMKGRNVEKRLAVVEVASLDTRRRLVLIRRDDTEHLVLLGNTTDLLIETNIKPAQQRPGSPGGSFQSALQSSGEQRR